jgi:putative membrane protein
MSVLTADETKRVEHVIAEVEHHTAAEIVVSTIKQSEPYTDVRLWSVLAFAAVSATLGHFARPDWGVGIILSLQFAVALVTWFASGLPGVLRALIPQPRSQGAVERAAELAFLEQGVFDTKGRTGVLILLSELEHKVVILGDQGIHARVHTAGWNEHVAHLGARIREGKSGDGLCEVIQRLGEALANTVPVEGENPNELDNRVRTQEPASKALRRKKPGDEPGE